MRPLRLLLSLSTSLIAVSLLLYLALGSPQNEEFESASSSASKGNVKALFSFTSPGSLFPPSAIISLTDDNSTFFLARPAAFGPALPKDGLSGPLWIGSGFGEETLGKGELGCADVPGWDAGRDGLLDTTTSSVQLKSRAMNPASVKANAKLTEGDKTETHKRTLDDGILDHLHPSTRENHKTRSTGHADIHLLQEIAEMAGKIALLKRGGCGFLAKVQWAQRRGATAVIVGDDVRGGALIRMYAKGDTSNITIPSLFTSHTTAHLLSSLLPSEGPLLDFVADENSALEADGRPLSDKIQDSKSRPTSTKAAPKSTDSSKHEKYYIPVPAEGASHIPIGKPDWLHRFLSAIGFGRGDGNFSNASSRRLPNIGDWDDDQSPVETKSATLSRPSTVVSDGFNIGDQDWHDPGLLPGPLSTAGVGNAANPIEAIIKATGNALPRSRAYTHAAGKGFERNRRSGTRDGISLEARSRYAQTRSVTSMTGTELKNVEASPVDTASHKGLWVTLTPTNVSTSPFFDTLLVLVVSPLVTLTVVYALLLLRSRIRRRRWRAPKSVVERLPVRTYQTISSSSMSPTPDASSPTTPLLQHSSDQSTSSTTCLRSRVESEVPATPSTVQHGARDREEEKRESGLAAWRRRYGGRQRECVVCLEEYEDGVSQVMSLPCGHEFHADCM